MEDSPASLHGDRNIYSVVYCQITALSFNIAPRSTTISHQKTKQAFQDWQDQLDGCFAVTGTALQKLQLGETSAWEKISVSKLECNTNFFITKLSRYLYGRAKVRRGYKVKFAGNIEGEPCGQLKGHQDLHVHFAVEIDFQQLREDISIQDIPDIIEDIWRNTAWGNDQCKVVVIRDLKEWNKYTLKHFSSERTERFITNTKYIHEPKIRGNARRG